ncbi:serine/threonine protein kinase PrkC, regulator of stationary phase [Lachnospiraceae bacterium KM106-2]|nr:serine/threonine protein kinase PrkC, regulator of stationary phase [Lachnospiraceae bacterium KM106-2]
MLEIGSVVDGTYKVLNKIGQGGMSVVYLAMNERANKQWAIKEVRRQGVKDFDVVRQSLIAETDMLKKLKHKHLPSIVDVIENEGNFLIVMDYIQGITLKKALEENGALDQDDVIKWAVQLCDVLGYLHTRKPPIIYRDTKPANIMLKPDGDIVLIDFGTAREYKQYNVADTTCLGTQGYAAPEQFGGHGQTDARTDIYNLGATLYHLVTGQNPSEPPYEMRPIREINPSLSSGLEKIILKCTQRNPDDRYQSCSQLMYALEHIEEIDDKYRRRQKKKMFGFVSVVILMCVSFIASFYTNWLAVKTRTIDYKTEIEIGDKAAAHKEKIEAYKKAVNIDPSKSSAYMKIVDEDVADLEFTSEEELSMRALLQTISTNQKVINQQLLQEDKEEYAKFAFRLGTAYWYYFYADTNSHTQAAAWFKDVVSYGLEDKNDMKKAKLFCDIGTFYKNVKQQQEMGNDDGMYKKYWKTLMNLKREYEKESTGESIMFWLYKEIVSQTSEYRLYFKNDGISYEEINQTLLDIQQKLPEFTLMKHSKKEELEQLMENVNDAIILVDSAYHKD